MALTKEQEEQRAAAMAAGQARASGAPASSAGQPSASRLTLARAAIRPAMNGRVMLSGPAGAGKTYTSLVIASTLVGPNGRILVIDTEKESSLTYADVFAFDQLPWNPPFDPTALSLTLKAAAAQFDAIIIDSFSHFWRKQGGVLDIAGDNVRGWKAARPIQENLIETLLDVDAHVIVCCRSKMEHLIEDKGGRITVTKAGIKAQQDDDLEYEVNVALELDMAHILHVVKSRTNAVPVGSQFLAGLGGDFAQQYREWLAAGEPVAPKEATDALRARVNAITDIGLRGRVQGEFLDTFGRPEFLLVSRLAEAQQWIEDAVAGRLPIERGEDDVPAESEPAEDGAAAMSESPSPASSAPRRAHAPAPPAGDAQRPTDAAAAHPPCDDDAAGNVVAGEVTGYCSRCGGPIWFGVDCWLHADEEDADACRAARVEPAGSDVDVEALYAAAHPKATADRSAREAAIEAEVQAMSHSRIVQALKDNGLSVTGTPRTLKARWIAHRFASELDALSA